MMRSSLLVYVGRNTLDIGHNQPPAKPARRKPLAMYGQFRINCHNKPSLQDGNYGFLLAFAFFLPIFMFPCSLAFMFACSLAFMFACTLPFALVVFALVVVFELLVVVQPDQKTDAESKNTKAIVRRIEVPPMSLLC